MKGYDLVTEKQMDETHIVDLTSKKPSFLRIPVSEKFRVVANEDSFNLVAIQLSKLEPTTTTKSFTPASITSGKRPTRKAKEKAILHNFSKSDPEVSNIDREKTVCTVVAQWNFPCPLFLENHFSKHCSLSLALCPLCKLSVARAKWLFESGHFQSLLTCIWDTKRITL
ncbi:hypothetical protein Ciccas_002749 [Cichlidogyrus casuarinus]|uniref:Uncharacterized protein n=1 Tax=Cichlidogyrus casuarinus TaxID=1844966 RepID=A0ABD2QGC7_9PLAT